MILVAHHVAVERDCWSCGEGPAPVTLYPGGEPQPFCRTCAIVILAGFIAGLVARETPRV